MAQRVDLPNRLREGIEILLSDMEEFQLVVEKVPAPEQRHSGHSVRAATSQNASWYRDFCDRHQKNRSKPHHGSEWKSDTKIVRKTFIETLERWLAQGWTLSPYAEELLDIAAERLAEEEERWAEQEAYYQQEDDDDQVPF
jgi:hypothetical protein